MVNKRNSAEGNSLFTNNNSRSSGCSSPGCKVTSISPKICPLVCTTSNSLRNFANCSAVICRMTVPSVEPADPDRIGRVGFDAAG